MPVPECSVRSLRIMKAFFARGMTGLQAKCLSVGVMKNHVAAEWRAGVADTP